ncbi:MAG: YaeQ family protein [Neptunomonas phycophila]|uniref:YaeQ family protein n=1 Tax=Neptunomonas phycophila TaxID=1572645 RepID=UPI003B8E5308
MALKPTIYKIDLQIVDFNRNLYPSVKLTLALHPSELPERMMVRLLAYALNYHEDLEFCKGLSAADEADLWQVAPTQEIMEWIEVGQVSPDRLRKAVSRAANIKLYAYGSESEIWWQRFSDDFARLSKVEIYRFKYEEVKVLIPWVDRSIDLSVTISGNDLMLNSGDNHHTLSVSQYL